MPVKAQVVSASVTRREWLALALILAVAGLLRMGWPGLTEFKQDEAHLYGLALDVAEFRVFHLRGISYSVGLPHSPVSVYLLAVPLLLWKSPLAATLFMGALNTASVGVAYFTARRYWGRTAALAGALLYATAPWAVMFSRKLWTNNLLPLFVAGYVLAGLLAFVEGRRGWLIAHLALLALAVQLHLSAAALVVVTAGLLLVHWRRFGVRAMLTGAAVMVLAAAPYLFYLLIRLGDWWPFLSSARSGSLQVTPEALTLAALIVQGTYLHSLAGPDAFRTLLATLPNLNPILWLGGLLVVLGLVLALLSWVDTRRGRLGTWLPLGERPGGAAHGAAWIVALLVAVPVLFFVPHATPVYHWYLIILFPSAFLMAGFAFAVLLRFVPLGWPRIAAWALPLMIAGSQAWLLAGTLRFVATIHTPNAFGTPLSTWLQSAQSARGLGSEVIVVAEGTDPAVDQAPAVFDVLLRHTPHRFVDGRTTAVFPVGDAAVLLWPAVQAYDWPVEALYQEWGGGRWAARVPLRLGEGEALIAVGAGAQPDVPNPREASALLANGVELLGATEAGGGWELWWRAPGPDTGEHFHFFAHLLDEGGDRLAQMDAPTYAPDAWRSGDLVVSYFALPAGGAQVRAGMYAFPSLAPVAVLDGAGNPAGEWLVFER